MINQSVTVLNRAELKECVGLDDVSLSVVEEAFAALARDKVVMPSVLSMDLPMVNGEVDVKTAYIEGFDGFAIKVSPGFFDNPKIGFASLNGLMILFDAKTGIVDAVLLDGGYLTDLRTAAAGGVAARHLAPSKVQAATVFGSGLQACLQMKAAFLAKPFERGFVWARNMDKAQDLSDRLSDRLGVPFSATTDPGDAVAQSQLVVTATAANEPVFDRDWLHEGLHITAMGSDQDGKNELDPRVLEVADLYVADHIGQCEQLGELRSARKHGFLMHGMMPELGQIVAGEREGRTSDTDITVCDLTGTGVQDTAIATHAVKAAAQAGMGTRFDLGALIGNG